MPAVSRRVGPAGPHAPRVCGGRGGARRRRLDQIRVNSAVHRGTASADTCPAVLPGSSSADGHVVVKLSRDRLLRRSFHAGGSICARQVGGRSRVRRSPLVTVELCPIWHARGHGSNLTTGQRGFS